MKDFNMTPGDTPIGGEPLGPLATVSSPATARARVRRPAVEAPAPLAANSVRLASLEWELEVLIEAARVAVDCYDVPYHDARDIFRRQGNEAAAERMRILMRQIVLIRSGVSEADADAPWFATL